MPAPAPFECLVKTLSKLPTIGRRSAERMAYHLVEQRDDLLPALIGALTGARDQLTHCSRCGSLTLRDKDPCAICADPRREPMLCVVEEASDVAAIEQAGAFRGRYHVLGGHLSAMQGKGPDDLRLEPLKRRIREEGIKEICLALNTNVESDATSHFLASYLAGEPVKVTRPAFGLPAGSGIEYADSITLTRALRGRAPVAE